MEQPDLEPMLLQAGQACSVHIWQRLFANMPGRLFTCRHHLNEGQQAAQWGRRHRSGNPWKRHCALQQRATVASATLMRDTEQDASQWMTPQDPMPQQVSKREVCCPADQPGLTCGGRLWATSPCHLYLSTDDGCASISRGNGRAKA